MTGEYFRLFQYFVPEVANPRTFLGEGAGGNDAPAFDQRQFVGTAPQRQIDRPHAVGAPGGDQAVFDQAIQLAALSGYSTRSGNSFDCASTQ